MTWARCWRAGRRAAAVAVAALVMWLVVWPAQWGGDTGYTVVSGQSMEPTLSTGDLVVTRTRDAYEVGDVVVYRVPAGEPGEGRQVIHRVAAVDPAGTYTLLGDNRDSPDIWHPGPGDVVGAEVMVVPGAGHLVVLLRGPVGFGLLAGALVAAAVLATGDDEDDEEAGGDDEDDEEAGGDDEDDEEAGGDDEEEQPHVQAQEEAGEEGEEERAGAAEEGAAGEADAGAAAQDGGADAVAVEGADREVTVAASSHRSTPDPTPGGGVGL